MDQTTVERVQELIFNRRMRHIERMQYAENNQDIEDSVRIYKFHAIAEQELSELSYDIQQINDPATE